MKWRPFYVFPRELWKVQKAKIFLVKWPINGELITVITRLKTRLPSILNETQSYTRFSLPSREVSGVERQLGVVRVVVDCLFISFASLFFSSVPVKHHKKVSLPNV